MKLLIVIPTYGSGNVEYLKRCLDEYFSYTTHDISVHIYHTEELNIEHRNITKHKCNERIKHNLVNEHQRLFIKYKDKYDYFLYAEDDILITEDVLNRCIKSNEKMEMPLICGMLRYELKADEEYKYLIDCHPYHSVWRGGTQQDIIKSQVISNGKTYYDLYNVHQGCYLVSKKQLNYAIQSGNYIFTGKKMYCGTLESAASNIYAFCGLRKLIPIKHVSNLLIHHLPNKYVRTWPELYSQVIVPDDKTLVNMTKI